jgi:hypothetical protein
MLKKLKITADDFEEWLRERGYARMMGEENLRIYLNKGMAGLFFSNSNLLMSCLFTKLGMPSGRVADRIRAEVGKNIRKIYADNYMIELEVEFYDQR